MAAKDLSAPFTLYSFQFSVRSIMIQLAYEMRGAPSDGRPDMTLQRHYIDIGPPRLAQLDEAYLCKINGNGTVPALANEVVLETPMADTVQISWYLCDWYPNLLPREHEQVIRQLVEEVHTINFHVLTFGIDSPIRAGVKKKAPEIMKRDISEEYRAALKHKLGGLHEGDEEELKQHGKKTLRFLGKITELMDKHADKRQGEFAYIFGSEPTMLDAHVVCVVGRMHDKRRFDLIPPALVKWYEHFSAGDMWKRAAPEGTTHPLGT